MNTFKKWLHRQLFISLIIVLIGISCSKEDDGNNMPQTVDEVITKAGTPEEVESKTDSVVLEEDYDFNNNWICKTVEVDATQARGDYRTFDPNSEIIWPGNLLQGASITKSTPDPIVVERAGGTFTINLINGSNSLKTQDSIGKVNQSNVVSALNKIISNNSGAIPANFTYVMQEVQSREQLALSMGVNVNTLTTDVNTKLSFSSDKSYNRFLVDFTQIYYTMIYEKPTSYDQVFAPSVTADDLTPYMSEDNPPVYISSVTYGRRFYLLIESTSSSQEMSASIKASYDAAIGGVDISGNAKYVTELSEMNIKIFAMGGDADAALGAFNGDLSGLQAYLQDGGDYFKAAPLSYVMTSLAPPQKQVGIGVTSKYTVQQCKPIYEVAPPQFMKDWYNVFDGEGIGAAAAIDPEQNNVYLFNESGTQYAVSQNGTINNIYNLSDGDHPLAGCPFDTISAALVFPNGSLYVFNKTGLHYASFSTQGSWSGIFELWQWGDDNTLPVRVGARDIPGVGAGLNYTGDRVILFDMTGQHWFLYNANSGVSGGLIPLSSWGADLGPEWNIPFLGDGVGVAVQVKTDYFIPHPESAVVGTGKDYHQVLFNKEGTKAAVYHGSVGFSPVYDLVSSEE